jgi:hypothetical protein
MPAPRGPKFGGVSFGCLAQRLASLKSAGAGAGLATARGGCPLAVRLSGRLSG